MVTSDTAAPVWGHQAFGVEIEVESITISRATAVVDRVLGGTYGSLRMADGRRWKVVSDGSLCGGCEVVSPKLMYADIPLVQDVVRALRSAGAKVNGRTGLHIHVDASGHNGKSLRTLVRMVRAQEDLILKALNVNPSRQRFCQPIDERFLRALRSARRNRQSLARTWYSTHNGGRRVDVRRETGHHYNHTRYHGVNLHAVWSHGTVEFRYFNGTLHAGEMRSYINLVLAISHRALMCQGVTANRSTVHGRYTLRRRFRKFLYKLGFKGSEWKVVREHLLKHLRNDNVPTERVRRVPSETPNAGSTISNHIDSLFSSTRSQEIVDAERVASERYRAYTRAVGIANIVATREAYRAAQQRVDALRQSSTTGAR